MCCVVAVAGMLVQWHMCLHALFWGYVINVIDVLCCGCCWSVVPVTHVSTCYIVRLCNQWDWCVVLWLLLVCWFSDTCVYMFSKVLFWGYVISVIDVLCCGCCWSVVPVTHVSTCYIVRLCNQWDWCVVLWLLLVCWFSDTCVYMLYCEVM